LPSNWALVTTAAKSAISQILLASNCFDANRIFLYFSLPLLVPQGLCHPFPRIEQFLVFFRSSQVLAYFLFDL
ncbi:hypothetical protein, partial [Intestinimonas sp.]|uniref:hypothetical protein n=1 Tax=Intestinimonas sp. TaxID=1965293 RepID=UPI003AACD59D